MAKATLQNFERAVTAKVFQRGKQYFNSGRVLTLKESTPGNWEATVEGSEEEFEVHVSLDRDDIIRNYSCDCPYDWGEMCKHTIAVLLKIKETAVKPAPTVIVTPAAPAVIVPLSRTTEQLMSRYLQLSDSEQKVIKVAALQWEFFTLNTLVDTFNNANLKFDGLSFRPMDAKPLMDKLLAEGFWTMKANNYRSLETFSERLCDTRFDIDSDFQKIALSIQRRTTSNFWVMHDGGLRYFRDMRLARYTGNVEAFKNSYNLLLNPHISKQTQTTLINYWMPTPFDLPRIERLPLSIRTFLLTEKLTLQTLFLYLPDAWFLYTIDKIADFEPTARLNVARLLGQLFILQGDWASIEKISPHFGNLNTLVFAGTRLLLQGDGAAASEAFVQATKALRKQVGSNKEVLVNMAGIFQILALLKLQDASLYPKITDLISKGIKNTSSYSVVYHWLQGVLYFLQNNKAAALQDLQVNVQADQFTYFFKMLCQFWVDEKLVDRHQLKAFHQTAKDRQYHWIAAETQAMLAEYDSTHSIGLTEALEKSGVTTPLIHLLPRIEEWENALKLLIGLANPASKKNAKENDARLIWVVNFESAYIQAKEQSYGKTGWTSGRPIAFKRLGTGELTYLTEQDKGIVSSIQVAYGSEIAVQDINTWKRLIGHPLLFLWKSPEVGVQLSEGKPSLIAKRSDKGYLLQFSHNVTSAGFQLVKETPTRYVLLQVTEQMAQIARAFNGKALTVPEQGEAQLKAVVAGLSGMVDVQSVFEDENLPSIPPDSHICVHLLPVGNGFHVELYVKPFGLIPPYVKPGDGEPTLTASLDGVRTRTTRDLKAEKKNVDKLRKEVETLAKLRPRDGVWILDDAQQCLELLMQLQPLVNTKDIILEWPKGEKFRITNVAGFDQFRMSVTEKGHWFEVEGELRVDEDKVLTMQELLALSQRKEQFVELSPGKFLALTEEFRRRLRSIDGLMAAQKNGALQLHPLAAAALDPFTEALKNFKPDKKFKESRQRLEKAFSQKFELPKNFKASLRPYQLDGFQWLHRCAAWGVGACLADDMGLGKTIQALAFLTDRAPMGAALVVAPASVCRNWVAEIEKFAPALRSVLFGEGDRAAEIEAAGPGDIVIVTYDLMAREGDNFLKKKFATLLLDEAQAIKNKATKRSEIAMKLQGDFRMVMSGTPLENHLGELWNLFQFINPGLLGSIESFNERFAMPIERQKDADRRDQLRRLVQPFILRRRKDEVLKDLPAKTEITLTVELPPDERAFYEALRRNALEKLVNSDAGAGEKHLQILAELMKLRRAACHPKLADANAKFTDSAKLRLFAEIVDELLENGHKALVFSQFVGHLEILEAYLKKKKISYQYLDGSTPLATRQKRIEAFQAGEGDLFLISLKAGGTGLNLTAADYVIHCDPWWNPAVEDQATDRAHRIGQEKPVTVYRLVAEATIEEKILKLHEHKRDLADSLLTGTDVSARLSAEDLLALMREA